MASNAQGRAAVCSPRSKLMRASKACGALYLLTTTAAPFFARHGYAVIERDHAPAPLQAAAEFAGLRPASAICVPKTLTESNA